MVLAAVAGPAAWLLLAANATAVARVPRDATTPENRNRPAARITSRSVLRAALARDTVQGLPSVRRQRDPLAWLEGALKVDDHDGSDFLTVAWSGPDPQEALALVRAVAGAYQEEVAQAEYADRRRRALALDRAYAEASSRLSRKQEALGRLAEGQGVSEPAALARKQLNLLTQAGDVRRQQVQVRSERRKAELRRQAYQARGAAAPEIRLPESALAAALGADPAAKQYLARRERLEAIVALYEQHAVRKDETARVVAEQQIADLEKKLAARREALRADLIAQERRKARSEFTAALAELDAQTEGLRKQEQALDVEYRALETQAGQIGKSLAAFEQLRREVAGDEKRADGLRSQVEAAHAELRSPQRLALAPELTVHNAGSRRRILGTVLACLAALGAGGLGVRWLESQSRRVAAPAAAVPDLAHRQAEMAPLVQALREMREQQEQMARHRDELARQCQALRDEREERRGRMNEQERRLAALHRELEAARTEAAGQQRQLHRLSDEQTRAAADRDKLGEAFAVQRQQWDQERAALQREVERLRREAGALRQARDAALRQAEGLSPELDPLASYPGQNRALSRDEEQRLRAEVERLTRELEHQRAEAEAAAAPQPARTSQPGGDAAALPAVPQSPVPMARCWSDEERQSVQKELARLRQALAERDAVLAELRRQGVAELDNYWATEGLHEDPVPAWTWSQCEQRGEALPSRSVDRHRRE